MFNENQKIILQMGALVVIVFFLALAFGSGFLPALLWAIILGLVVSLLMNANRRALDGGNIFHNIANDPELRDLRAVGSRTVEKVKAVSSEAKEKAEEAMPSGDSGSSDPATQSHATSADDGATLEPSADTRGSKPSGMKEPRDGDPDDLTRISGVGPKLRDMLHDHGYYHFDQIANWSEEEVVWIDDALEGFKGRASRDNWVGQAKILAAEKSASTD